MKIGLIQSKSFSEQSKNSDSTIKKISDLAEEGAQIICLQELFLNLYFPHNPNQDQTVNALEISGSWMSKWKELCKKKQIVLILPFYEKSNEGKYFNSVVVIDASGEVVGHYRKNHIPHDPYFWEQDYFSPGDLGYPIIRTRYGTIGVLVCYDQWFPEPARELALKGAQIIFYPTAIGNVQKLNESEDTQSAWVTMHQSHAIANNVHVVAVNRVGEEGQIQFWGQSLVCDSFGQILKKASSDQEENICVDVDLKLNLKLREEWGFFRNLRRETYSLHCEQSQQYYLPPEWETHEGVWLAWPYGNESFEGVLGDTQNCYIQIIEKLIPGEKVFLLVRNEEMKIDVSKKIKHINIDDKKINWVFASYQDVWVRDYGPIYLFDETKLSRVMSHWNFNAWGNQYPHLISDTFVPFLLAQHLRENYSRVLFTLEGGAVETNGKGVLLSTISCLYDPERNPYQNKQQIHNILMKYLGVTNIICLKYGLIGDDTKGHIDQVARFSSSDTILYAMPDDKMDENYKQLHENELILKQSKNINNQPFNLIPVPLPKVYLKNGERASASYLNFYISNQCVLVPVFDDSISDKKALEIISANFPNYDIHGINCKSLIEGGGSIHCITQQIPELRNK